MTDELTRQLAELSHRVLALEERQANVVRAGVVVSVDEEGHRVKCKLPAADNVVTDWLPVLTARAGAEGAAQYDLPAKGEQGPCLFLARGLKAGFYLGSIFSDEDPPPVEDKAKFHRRFRGGAYVEVDESEKKFVFHVPEGWCLYLGGDGEEARKVARVGDMVHVTFGSSTGMHPIVEGSELVRSS